MFIVYKNNNITKRTKTYLSDKDITEEDILFNDVTPEIVTFSYTSPEYITMKTERELTTKYRTLYTEVLLPAIRQKTRLIHNFFDQNNFLENKENFYTHFRIPKRKGGYRELIDPAPELKRLQRNILDFLTDTLRLHPHNAAHGFVKNRDMYTNALAHKGSRHIVTMDIEDFFPSISEELLHAHLSQISFLAQPESQDFVSAIIQLATLNGCLPQGSPLSPFLSNLVMLEFDYEISEKLRSMYQNKINTFSDVPYAQFIKYTRYADDMTFSSTRPININVLQDIVKEYLHKSYGNLIKLKESKTKYLMNTKRCFITGIKYNQEQNLTIGHEKKKELKHKLHQLFVQFENNNLTREEVQEVLGYFSFLSRVEPDYAKYLSRRYLRIFRSTSETLHDHFKPILQGQLD